MTATYYVKFNRHGIVDFCKTDNFKLKADEHAVCMELEVPDSIFIKPPIPVTRIIIEPTQVVRNISAETTQQDASE